LIASTSRVMAIAKMPSLNASRTDLLNLAICLPELAFGFAMLTFSFLGSTFSFLDLSFDQPIGFLKELPDIIQSGLSRRHNSARVIAVNLYYTILSSCRVCPHHCTQPPFRC
jgi:hypothetical protein